MNWQGELSIGGWMTGYKKDEVARWMKVLTG